MVRGAAAVRVGTLAWRWHPVTGMQGGALSMLLRSNFVKSSLAKPAMPGRLKGSEAYC